MALGVRAGPRGQLLRRQVLASFSAEMLYIPVYFLVQLPFFGFQQEMMSVILLVFMGVIGLLWLAVWLTALVTAVRRRDEAWIRAFIWWGMLAIAVLAFLHTALVPAVFVSFILNLLLLGRGYYSLAFFALIVIAACLIPVPLEAWHYADVLARRGR